MWFRSAKLVPFPMIYSRSVEYAVRAFMHLGALPGREYALVKTIALEAGLPAPFLAHILQTLVRAGLLDSSKGPGGGFRLRVPASEISLARLVDAVDGPGRYLRCPAGLAECSDRAECGMHDSFQPVRSRIIEYLEGTSVADLAKSLGAKRRLHARQRGRGSKTGRAAK
jgi:Rrf2 family protein